MHEFRMVWAFLPFRVKSMKNVPLLFYGRVIPEESPSMNR